MAFPSLDELIAYPNLPTLPTVAAEVLELTRDEDVALDEIAGVVQNDPALTGRILKTVNSSFFGLRKPCPTISRAIGLLGLNPVKSLVLSFSLTDMTRRGDNGLDLAEYWQRCLYSAVAARRIATVSGLCDPEEAFVAALLQDIGMLALDSALGDQYLSILREVGAEHCRVIDVERSTLGFHHGDAGARLGERWRLPEAIIDPIRCHHELPSAGSGEDVLVRIVAIAYQMYNVIKGEQREIAWSCVLERSGELLDMPESDVTVMLNELATEIGELSSLLKVDVGSIPELTAEAGEALLAHHVEVERQQEALIVRNRELTTEATTDGLTGVANRKHFDDTLARHFESASAMKGALGLVLIDADRFKSLNDTHGHQAGDAVLVELAGRCRETIGERGLVCRYGGEEFAVILPGATRSDVARAAEQLRVVLETRPFDLGDAGAAVREIAVTASFGAATLEPDTAAVIKTPAHLVKAADRALYVAKESGRNCVRVFSPSPRTSPRTSAA